MHSAGSNANILAKHTRKTVREILAEYAGREAELEQARSEVEEKKGGAEEPVGSQVDTARVDRIRGLKAFPPLIMPPALKQPDLKDRLIKIFGLAKALVPVKRVTDYQSSKGAVVKRKGDAFSNDITFSLGRHDSAAVTGLLERGCPEELVERAHLYYIGNGTMQGLLKRLGEGLSAGSQSRGLLPSVTTCLSLFPHRPVHLCLQVDEMEYAPNLKCSYGMPYTENSKLDTVLVEGKQQVLFEIACKKAQEYLDMSRRSQGELVSHFNSHPEEYVVMIKPKYEIMERKNFLEKVRPYYVYPAPLSLLYGYLSDQIQGSIECFWENPLSCMMVGFSWAHGGASVFLDYVRGMSRGSAKFLVYSDDITLVVKGNYGGCWVVAMDVKHLDMSFKQRHTAWLMRSLKGLLQGAERADAWKVILALWVGHAIEAPTLFNKALAFVTHMIHSGVGGTTLLDCLLVGAVIGGGMTEFFAATSSKDVEEAVDGLVKHMFDHGLIVKEETKVVHTFSPGEEKSELVEGWTSSFTILGQKLCVHDGELLPKPDEQSLVNSHIFPRPLKDRSTRSELINRASRAQGLAVSGGYWFEYMYKELKHSYETAVAELDASALAELQAAGVPVEKGYEKVDVRSLFLKGFPTRIALENVYRRTIKLDPIMSRPQDVYEPAPEQPVGAYVLVLPSLPKTPHPEKVQKDKGHAARALVRRQAWVAKQKEEKKQTPPAAAKSKGGGKAEKPKGVPAAAKAMSSGKGANLRAHKGVINLPDVDEIVESEDEEVTPVFHADDSGSEGYLTN